MPPGPEGALLIQLQTFMGKNMETVKNVIQLNAAKLSLSITKLENKLVNSVANVSDDLNVQFNEVKTNFEDNSVKLDGFQKMVDTLSLVWNRKYRSIRLTS